MNLKPLKAAVLLGIAAIASFSAPAFALAIPNHSPVSTHMQWVNYSPNNVFQVTAYRGMASQITFAPNEHVTGISLGFSQGWQVESTGNHLILKPISITAPQTQSTESNGQVQTQTVNVTVQPTPYHWNTNLLVNTNLRTYAFNLKLGWGNQGLRANTYNLFFRYPQVAYAQRLAKQRQEAKKVPAQIAAMDKKLNERSLLESRANSETQTLNANYVMQVGKDSQGIAPVQVYDNGRFTYFTFSPNAPIPALFTVSATGTESLVNESINPRFPDTVVVHRISKQWVLRLGKEVVGVTSQGYGLVTVNNLSGSSLANTVRVLR